MVVGIVVKFILMLVCHRYKSPGTRLLAMDQRNDVLTNTVALACGLIGTHYWIYMDPLGAVLVWSVSPIQHMSTSIPVDT
jgi:divalent metal cation (Fe/Co/Zn/Cd) transporter